MKTSTLQNGYDNYSFAYSCAVGTITVKSKEEKKITNGDA